MQLRPAMGELKPNAEHWPSPCALASGIRVHVVARNCRDALMAFIDPDVAEWDKAQLVAWLAHYTVVANYSLPVASEHEAETRATSDVAPSSLVTQIESENRGAMVRAARDAVIAKLKRAVSNGDMSFASDAIVAKTVRPCRDSWGSDGWVPVDSAPMLLEQRVLSLAAVDCLVRPADYLAVLATCTRCDAISFDAQARSLGTCAAHTPNLRRVPWGS